MRIFQKPSTQEGDEVRPLEAADTNNAATLGAGASRQTPRELVGLRARVRASALDIARHAHTAPDRLLLNNRFMARYFPESQVRRLPENRMRHLVEDTLSKGPYRQRKALDKAFVWFDLPESGVSDYRQMSEFQEQIVRLVELLKRIDQFANPADVYERVSKVGANLTQFLSESGSDLEPRLIGYLYGLQRSLQERADMADTENKRTVSFDVVQQLDKKIKQLPSEKKAEAYACLTRNGWRK